MHGCIRQGAVGLEGCFTIHRLWHALDVENVLGGRQKRDECEGVVQVRWHWVFTDFVEISAQLHGHVFGNPLGNVRFADTRSAVKVDVVATAKSVQGVVCHLGWRDCGHV